MSKINFSELFAKNVLQTYYYKNIKLLQGDNFSLRIPDLYSKNHAIGIEVAQAELREDFLVDTIASELSHLAQETEKEQFLQRKLKNKPELEKDFALHKNVANLQTSFPLLQAQKIALELPIFLNLVNEKLLRAKKGNYSGCKEVNLCIVSYYRSRDLDLVYEFAKELAALKQKQFQEVFLIFSTSLFILHHNGNITVVDYSDDEFMELQHQTEQELLVLRRKQTMLKQQKAIIKPKPKKDKVMKTK